jgi:hypothetical protein
MKKIIVWSILSALIIGIIVWCASVIFSFSYADWSFLIGLGLSVVIFFFNSSGGGLSNLATGESSEAIWKIQKDDNTPRANVGAIFYGSVLYTIFTLIVMTISYF